MASKSLFFMAASGRGVTLGGDIYMTHFVDGTAECLANDGRTTRIALGSQNWRRVFISAALDGKADVARLAVIDGLWPQADAWLTCRLLKDRLYW